MNPHAAIARDEFERTIEELRAEMKANSSEAAAADGAAAERGPEALALRAEFRLFKWFGGLALAAILGGMGLLYQSIQQGLAGQREATQRQFAELRAEMNAGFRAMTAHVDARFDGVDSRFNGVDSRFDSVDSRFDSVDARFERVDARFDDVDDRFDNVDARFAALERDVSDVRERLARVETLLDVKNRAVLPD